MGSLAACSDQIPLSGGERGTGVCPPPFINKRASNVEISIKQRNIKQFAGRTPLLPLLALLPLRTLTHLVQLCVSINGRKIAILWRVFVDERPSRYIRPAKCHFTIVL